MMSDTYGMVPGLTTARETYEAEFRWGSQYQGVFTNALIDGNTVDSGSSPTYELRPGLLLGQVTSSGKWKNYSKTASDGSEVAAGVLIEAIRMQSFEGVATDRFYAILVGGPVQQAKLINFDNQARQQMNKFMFDDIGQMMGGHWYPWKRFVTKTADYSIVAADNYTMFDNIGAAGTVILTLPAIANGYLFGIRCEANQILRFTSNEGSNLIGSTTTQTSASITAIGGMVYIYSNAAGTKWIHEQAGTQTITFA